MPPPPSEDPLRTHCTVWQPTGTQEQRDHKQTSSVEQTPHPGPGTSGPPGTHTHTTETTYPPDGDVFATTGNNKLGMPLAGDIAPTRQATQARVADRTPVHG